MARSEERLAPGAVVEVADGVRRVVAGNAGPLTGPGTNTYVLGADRAVIVDPGPRDARHLETLLAATGGRVAAVLVTHTHQDHSPLAAILAERTGAQVLGRRAAQDGRQDPSCQPDRELVDGERLALGDAPPLRVIATPGHASNCLCFVREDSHLLFSGDTLLEGVTPVILPPDGDMSAYFDSLDRLAGAGIRAVAPGHGRLIADGPAAVAAVRAHRLARERKVLEALAASAGAGVSLAELVDRVYDDVPRERHGWARQTLLAHLHKLERDGRVCASDGRYRLAGP